MRTGEMSSAPSVGLLALVPGVEEGLQLLTDEHTGGTDRSPRLSRNLREKDREREIETERQRERWERICRWSFGAHIGI